MEGLISEQSFEIKKEESLNLNIRTETRDVMGKATDIIVGNSGMKFVIFDDGGNETAYMHYQPDGEEGLNTLSFQDQIRFSTVFCGAFYEFYEYWKNEDNFKDIKRPLLISGATNEKMSKFREDLFNNSENIIYNTVSKDPYYYRILLKDLEKNTEAINTLKNAHEICQRGKIKMKVIEKE